MDTVNNKTYRWTGSTYVEISQSASYNLNDLTDVDTTGKMNGHILRYNSTSSQWESQLLSSVSTLDDLTGATEITEYIVVRGLNSGIISIDKAVSNFVLTGMTRASAFTQIFLDTDGSPTGELAYINPSGFIVGDSIRICQYDASGIVTIEDATISPAPIASKNIYLTDTVPFVCQSNKSIELRLQYDPIFGLVWVENGRSTTQISSVGIQDVIDFNRDLINGNNYQGTGALTANSGINALGLGTNAGYNNQGDNINALGNSAVDTVASSIVTIS